MWPDLGSNQGHTAPLAVGQRFSQASLVTYGKDLERTVQHEEQLRRFGMEVRGRPGRTFAQCCPVGRQGSAGQPASVNR